MNPSLSDKFDQLTEWLSAVIDIVGAAEVKAQLEARKAAREAAKPSDTKENNPVKDTP